jgi:hypothetical protein
LLAGTDLTPKTLVEPIAVASTLYTNTVLMEQLAPTIAVSGAGQEKSDSDREPSPGDDSHSEAAVGIRMT